MTEPIVFISRNKIKVGKDEEFRKHYRDNINRTIAEKPGTFAQLAYVDEEITELNIIRFFPNADTFDEQINGADHRSKKTYTLIEPVSFEIFGAPNPATVEKMKDIVGSGVILKIHPNYVGGFIRSAEL